MAAVLWLCFELPSCLFGDTRDTFVMNEKAKFVCFIYMQSQKVKFKYAQINMKQVSYSMKVMIKPLLNAYTIHCLQFFYIYT